MYDYFKNIADKNNCSSEGECTIHPTTNSLYEIMLTQIREMSFYLVKLKEFGITNEKAMADAVESLSIFFINTNYNKKKYLSLVHKLYELKTQIKDKYTEYCTKHELPAEIINTNFKIEKNTTIAELINHFDSNNINKQKNSDKTKQRLFYLITIFVKIAALNIVKIKKIDKNFNDYDYEILRFFALTNAYSIRVEKIKRRILEFSNTTYNIKEKLFETYKNTYGQKQSATIPTSLSKGHGILISGDDLDELDALLKTLEKTNPKEQINVYTNGALFLAHFYPYFKNNKFLKGHYGSDNVQYDFSKFPGVILITQNFIQKIDNIYKGEIFSNKLISFDRVIDIEDNNYEKLIEAALNTKEISDSKEKTAVSINYKPHDIENFDYNSSKKVAIIAGRIDKTVIEKIKEENKNDRIIYLNCPLEIDILFNLVKNLEKHNIETTIFFAQCTLESLDSTLALLDKNVTLYLSDCPYVLINPHVKEALIEDFNVKIIS